MRKTLRICCILLALLFFACETPALPPVEDTALSPEPAATPAEIEVDTVIAEAVPETTAAPTMPPTPEPTPIPTPEPTPTPEPSPFGILWLPDTQLLSYSFPEKLTALGEEIAARREPENLIAVVHTGDLVDNGYKDWEWDNFDLCLSAFSNDLPFYPVAGNHDLGVNLLQYTAYLKRPFLQRLPADRTFGGGKMFCDILRVGEEELMVLGIGWDAGKSKAEREWLDTMLKAYPDTPCILVTHVFLKPDGTVFPRASYLEKTVISQYPNIRLVLCGHSRDFSSASFTYDDDGDGTPERTVHAMMLNRQTGSFQYRVLQFDPITRAVKVDTYSLGDGTVRQEDGEFSLSFTLENAF